MFRYAIIVVRKQRVWFNRRVRIIEGRCKKFPSDSNFKVPQISWNQIWPHDFKGSFDPKSPLKNIKIGEYMYFVHSYYVEVENEKNI